MTATTKQLVVEPNPKSNSQPKAEVKSLPKLKRIIWGTGGKGGVGKSTAMRGLYDLLRQKGINVSAFDGDRDNSQLYRFYQKFGGGVTKISLDKRGESDALIDAMDTEKPDVILVDVAAGGTQTLRSLEKDLRILSDAAELGYKFTIVSVISRVKDSVNLLKNTLKMTEPFDVDHIVLKNLYFGEPHRFRLFEGSNTKTALLQSGGLILELPELYDDTYELIDQRNLPFTLAVKAESGLARSHRTRVYQWLDLFEAQALIAGERLGL